MKTIKYILVNETGSETTVRAIRDSHVSEFRHHIVVNKRLSHGELIDHLCGLRRHWPEAKILGVSEIDPSAAYAPIRVSQWMNALRRELSDLL